MISKDDYERMNFQERLELLNVQESSPFYDSVMRYKEFDERYYYLSHCEELLYIDPSELIGTDHPRYQGKTLKQAFMNLKRGHQNVRYYFENPDHYVVAPRTTNRITIAEVEGKGKFIVEGNNRLIIAKILNLKEVLVDRCKIYRINYRLKNVIGELEKRGFKIIEDKFENDLVVSKNFLEFRTKDTSELQSIIQEYDNLSSSIFRVYIYRLRSFTDKDYKHKYYRVNRVKHWFHVNYLVFLESKSI